MWKLAQHAIGHGGVHAAHTYGLLGVDDVLEYALAAYKSLSLDAILTGQTVSHFRIRVWSAGNATRAHTRMVTQICSTRKAHCVTGDAIPSFQVLP